MSCCCCLNMLAPVTLSLKALTAIMAYGMWFWYIAAYRNRLVGYCCCTLIAFCHCCNQACNSTLVLTLVLIMLPCSATHHKGTAGTYAPQVHYYPKGVYPKNAESQPRLVVWKIGAARTLNFHVQFALCQIYVLALHLSFLLPRVELLALQTARADSWSHSDIPSHSLGQQAQPQQQQQSLEPRSAWQQANKA